ncbi:sporulation protein YtfJ [Vulcanibacillus modesticaldus]|uniref:Sporulation protein YtfJ n=1 Tax=Vulcanibacillus modesticaldus TaxID=337097 RepID=A0A1D2YSF3_9BACI|nr:GerW family sporulation protein [Vulcanibacillus modesticaldus]OEF97249.1 sporulation protein YtfJ [Vulcanibacillus modesticaldus]
MAGEHPIQGLMKTAMENIKEMVDVNTIVGEPVETPDGSVILPISKVGFGFAAGGSELNFESSEEKGNGGPQDKPFGGGSGGGISITPVAFLVVSRTNGVQLLPLDSETHIYERLINLAPQLMEKLQNSLKNKKQDASENNQQDYLS